MATSLGDSPAPHAHGASRAADTQPHNSLVLNCLAQAVGFTSPAVRSPVLASPTNSGPFSDHQALCVPVSTSQPHHPQRGLVRQAAYPGIPLLALPAHVAPLSDGDRQQAQTAPDPGAHDIVDSDATMRTRIALALLGTIHLCPFWPGLTTAQSRRSLPFGSSLPTLPFLLISAPAHSISHFTDGAIVEDGAHPRPGRSSRSTNEFARQRGGSNQGDSTFARSPRSLP